MKKTLAAVALAVSLTACVQQKAKPLGCAPFNATFDSIVTSQTGSHLLLGDSITYNLRHLADGMGYTNQGVPGNVTECVVEELGAVFKEKPAKVILAIGINDIRAKGFMVGSYIAMMKNIVRQMKAHDIAVSVRSIFPTSDRNYSGLILKTNVALADLAAEEEIPFLNTYPYLADDNEVIVPEYTKDGLHLSAAGNAIYIEHFLD